MHQESVALSHVRGAAATKPCIAAQKVSTTVGAAVKTATQVTALTADKDDQLFGWRYRKNAGNPPPTPCHKTNGSSTGSA
jgi:hypothetical protein